jgi:hypothetical protein
MQWISGAGDPRNAIHIVLAVTDPSNPSPHKRHSLILVEPSTKGVNVVRPMMVFGYDDAPEGHCEVLYENCQLDVESGVVGGRAGLGRGFEVCSLNLDHGMWRGELITDHPSSTWSWTITPLYEIYRNRIQSIRSNDGTSL